MPNYRTKIRQRHARGVHPRGRSIHLGRAVLGDTWLDHASAQLVLEHFSRGDDTDMTRQRRNAVEWMIVVGVLIVIAVFVFRIIG
jgi:hypothetical protein